MQSLYSYFSNNENNVMSSEKNFLAHINKVRELYILLFALLIEIIKYTDDFLDQGKNKFFPKETDLNPNRRFVENLFSNNLLHNNILLEEIGKLENIWIDNDHDLINKIFKEIFKSSIYESYINEDDNDVSVDQDFIIKVLNKHVFSHKLFHHILEEESIYWSDDLPFVATLLIYNVKSDVKVNIPSVFKEISDKDFAIQLFRDTIQYNQEYEDIIENFANNWDLDRIATIDKLLLKMAFVEILEMKDLPVKVSMNEYIEISKYYSTKKSKMFVNGILDNVVKYFKKEGRLK